MEKEYRIGEVARLLGVTQDTLRFYEEKEIIKPFKTENGYRCYTADDVWLLLDAIYYRKVNFSVSDVKNILYHNNCDAMEKLISEKIEEEKKSIKEHKYYLTKLETSYFSCKNVKEYLDVCSVLPFQRFYIMSPKRKDKETARDDWFQMIQEKSLYEVSNILEEYDLDSDYDTPVYFYLTLRGFTARKMRMEKKLEEAVPFLDYKRCIFTVAESDSRSPKKESIARAVDWAKEHLFRLVGKAYSQYTVNCNVDGRVVYYIEIYLPIQDEV